MNLWILTIAEFPEISNNGNELEQLAAIYDPDVICLQEARVQYKIAVTSTWNYHVPVIPGYIAISDPIFKRMVYIKKHLKFMQVKIRIVSIVMVMFPVYVSKIYLQMIYKRMKMFYIIRLLLLKQT